MKNMALIILALALMGSQCYAQAKYPKTSDKVITTSVDTLVITGNDFQAFDGYITNTSSTDTLAYRTELESTFANLLPRQAVYFNRFAKKLFRKALSGSMYSQLSTGQITSLGASVNSSGAPVYAVIDYIKGTNSIIHSPVATAFTPGDIIRDTATSKAFMEVNVTNVAGGSGFINGMRLSYDTALVAGFSVKALVYRDTTGMGASLATHNNPFQQRNALDSLFVDEVLISGTSDGTTAGGATGTRGRSNYIGSQFQCNPGSKSLFIVFVDATAFTPKLYGKFTLHTYCTSRPY